MGKKWSDICTRTCSLQYAHKWSEKGINNEMVNFADDTSYSKQSISQKVSLSWTLSDAATKNVDII